MSDGIKRLVFIKSPLTLAPKPLQAKEKKKKDIARTRLSQGHGMRHIQILFKSSLDPS